MCTKKHFKAVQARPKGTAQDIKQPTSASAQGEALVTMSSIQ
jgi:hypothetical protein